MSPSTIQDLALVRRDRHRHVESPSGDRTRSPDDSRIPARGGTSLRPRRLLSVAPAETRGGWGISPIRGGGPGARISGRGKSTSSAAQGPRARAARQKGSSSRVIRRIPRRGPPAVRGRTSSGPRPDTHARAPRRGRPRKPSRTGGDATLSRMVTGYPAPAPSGHPGWGDAGTTGPGASCKTAASLGPLSITSRVTAGALGAIPVSTRCAGLDRANANNPLSRCQVRPRKG